MNTFHTLVEPLIYGEFNYIKYIIPQRLTEKLMNCDYQWILLDTE